MKTNMWRIICASYKVFNRADVPVFCLDHIDEEQLRLCIQTENIFMQKLLLTPSVAVC